DHDWASSLAFSGDGGMIAFGRHNRIVLSEVTSGKELGRLEAPMEDVISLAFAPDGKALLSGSMDGKVRVWDLATRQPRLVLDGRGWHSRCMALSAAGKTVALATAFNVIRLWDVATGKECFEQPTGHDAPVNAVAFSPD